MASTRELENRLKARAGELKAALERITQLEAQAARIALVNPTPVPGGLVIANTPGLLLVSPPELEIVPASIPGDSVQLTACAMLVAVGAYAAARPNSLPITVPASIIDGHDQWNALFNGRSGMVELTHTKDVWNRAKKRSTSYLIDPADIAKGLAIAARVVSYSAPEEEIREGQHQVGLEVDRMLADPEEEEIPA